MVVCHKKKCIFIHIPKTAGTSIEQFLKDNGKNGLDYHGVRDGRSMHHFTAIELKKELPWCFNDYYKFSIVRNPYDRLLSEYYWTPIPNVGFRSGKTRAEFLDYVSYVVKNKLFFQNIYNDHFMPQFMFLYGKKLLVNHIFKFENMDLIVNFLKKKLEIENNLPMLNQSKIKKEYWNERQKERIYRLYKNDFIIFNYSK